MNIDAIVAHVAEIAVLQLNEALGLRDVKPICGRGDGSALVFRVRNATMQQLEVMLIATDDESDPWK